MNYNGHFAAMTYISVLQQKKKDKYIFTKMTTASKYSQSFSILFSISLKNYCNFHLSILSI